MAEFPAPTDGLLLTYLVVSRDRLVAGGTVHYALRWVSV
jgi:hypothetical protein